MPRTLDRTRRRDEIADAVESIAARHGFGAVTFRRVAEHLGSSTTVVTHLFDSRADLLSHVIDRATARRRSELTAHVGSLTGAPAIRALVEWAVLGLDDHAHRVWLAMVTGADADPLVRERLDAFNDWWDAEVERLAADLDGPADRSTLIDAIDVVVAGMVVAGVETDTLWDRDRRRATLDVLLGALHL